MLSLFRILFPRISRVSSVLQEMHDLKHCLKEAGRSLVHIVYVHVFTFTLFFGTTVSFISVCVCVSLSVCPSVCLLVCLHVSLCYMYMSLSVCGRLSMSFCVPCVSVCLSVYACAYMCISLPLFSVCVWV